MTDKTDTAVKADEADKAKPRRLSKSNRIHARRVKAAARAAGVART